MSYKSNTLRRFCAALWVFLGLSMGTAVAEEASSLTWQGDVGMSLQHHSNIVGSLDEDDDGLSLALLFSGGLYYDKFFIESSPFSPQPLTIGYTLNKTRSTMLNLVGRSSFATISEEFQEQGDLLDDIRDRDGSFEMGIEYLKQFPKSDLRISALHDALSRHQGFILSLDQSRPIYLTEWLIIPSWGVNYLSEKLVDYYYGVSPAEARVDRPAYSADAGWSLSGRVYVERPINQEWTLFGFVRYSHFSSSITDSPITSVSSGTHTIAVGVLWSF